MSRKLSVLQGFPVAFNPLGRESKKIKTKTKKKNFLKEESLALKKVCIYIYW